MTNKLLLAVIVISFLTGVVCGIALKSAAAPRTVYLPAQIKTEVITRKIPVRISETKFVEKERIITDSVYLLTPFSFNDSIKGKKDDVEFNITHLVDREKDSVKSSWNLLLDATVKDTAREKYIVELKEVVVTKPFFTNGWFWSTLIAIPLLLLAIIF